MKTFRLTLMFLLVALVTACASASPKNPQQAILVLRQNYTVAAEAAAYYGQQPFCDVTPGLVVCADRSIVAQLKVAKDAARPVIDQAEATVLNPKFDQSKADAIVLSAQNALKALTAITQALHLNIPAK